MMVKAIECNREGKQEEEEEEEEEVRGEGAGGGRGGSGCINDALQAWQMSPGSENATS
jgi:hypothetical protein